MFFAIVPDTTTAARVERSAPRRCGPAGLACRPIAAERLHISLYGLGEYNALPSSLVDRACRAAATVRAEPFDVAFDRCAEFGGRAVVLCGCRMQALLEFRQRLGFAMAAEPALRCFMTQRAYTPHMTMFYRRDASPFQEQTVDTIRWTVREFVLVHSLVGRGQHRRLGRWRLAMPS